MATYTKRLLSGSTDGMPIKITATVTAGTLIHTAVSGSSSFDEIWAWAVNEDTVDRLITIEYGDATAPDHNIKVTIPAQSGLVTILPGILLNNGETVKIFAAAANVVNVVGYVNRIA